MVATFMNSGMVLSIGIFFSLMIVGLSGTLHDSLLTNLTAHGVPHADAARAARAANLPPVSTLFGQPSIGTRRRRRTATAEHEAVAGQASCASARATASETVTAADTVS